MNKIIIVLIALLSSPLLADTIGTIQPIGMISIDPYETIRPTNTISKNQKRLDRDDYKSWDFKFSEKGTWKIACRTHCTNGFINWPFWCNLDYTGTNNGYKIFESTTIRLSIDKNGRAKLSETKSDDVIYYYFDKPNSFLEEAYDNN